MFFSSIKPFSFIEISGIVIPVSSSIKYIEDFCYYLNCTPGELILYINDKTDDIY